MDTLIEARDLVRLYPGVRAVDGVSLQVRRGQCLGLLGPNGAGKTTTLEMLEGIQTPSGGTVLFRGRPLDAAYREAIGIQFQATALQDFQTVAESLTLFASLYAKTADRAELVALCNLGEILDRDTRHLSGGQRQRLLLAIALVNDPELVFLDEPTTGLDPPVQTQPLGADRDGAPPRQDHPAHQPLHGGGAAPVRRGRHRRSRPHRRPGFAPGAGADAFPATAVRLPQGSWPAAEPLPEGAVSAAVPSRSTATTCVPSWSTWNGSGPT